MLNGKKETGNIIVDRVSERERSVYGWFFESTGCCCLGGEHGKNRYKLS